MKTVRLVLAAVLSVMIVFALGFCGGILYQRQADRPTVDAAVISQEIREMSELVTAELSYHGLVRVTDGQIPYLTRKSFGMIYTADILAGTDVSRADVRVTDTDVTVRLPASQVTSLSIDAESIRFYDEQWAIFNRTKRDDVTQAITLAETNARGAADIDALCERADEQAESVIRSLVTPMIGGRELTVILG